jgi:predicted dehydrogenase
MASELKVGVIGCGEHARGHFKMIELEPRMRLVAVADLDETRLARVRVEHGPEQTFQDYRAMLDAVELDAVYICTMPMAILPIALECLGRGVNASIEKPVGMDSRETRQMLAAARASGAVAMVSFDRRFQPEVLAARALLHERGGAEQVVANFHYPSLPDLYRDHPDPDLWRKLPPMIVCAGIHHVDLLRWLAGPSPAEAATAAEVFAHSWNGPREGTQRQNAIVRFDSGCHGAVMTHCGVGGGRPVEAHAEDLSIYFDPAGPFNLFGRVAPRMFVGGKPWEQPLDLDSVGGPHFNETTHFADCLLNGDKPWTSLDDAARSMELCEAILDGHKGPMAEWLSLTATQAAGPG